MSVSGDGTGSGVVGKRRRRQWSEDEKRRIVAETAEPGVSVSTVARRHDVNANMVFTWRREFGAGRSVAAIPATTFVPAVVGTSPIVAASPALISLAGRIEIALAGGSRVIVGADVDEAALARVIKILVRR
jgi:transposase